jgi:Ca2+-binding EF-hand superfamily protein
MGLDNVFLTFRGPSVQICSKFFVDGETRIKEIFEEFDPDNSGNIDYITWSMMLSPKVG